MPPAPLGVGEVTQSRPDLTQACARVAGCVASPHPMCTVCTQNFRMHISTMCTMCTQFFRVHISAHGASAKNSKIAARASGSSSMGAWPTPGASA